MFLMLNQQLCEEGTKDKAQCIARRTRVGALYHASPLCEGSRGQAVEQSHTLVNIERAKDVTLK